MAKFPKLKVECNSNNIEDAYVIYDGRKYRAKHKDDSSRMQIVIPNLVVLKLESPFCSQAEMEVKIWEKEREEKYGEYLVPIIDHKTKGDIYYVIQPYVRLIKSTSRISQAKIREIEPVIDYFVEKYDMCDLDWDDPGWNWGLRKSDKQPVIFDYGV